MKLHLIFNDAVAKEDTRYALRKPWKANDFVWATDGRMLARCPASGIMFDELFPHADEKHPDPRVVLDQGTWTGKPLKLPTSERLKTVTRPICEECCGSGDCAHCGSDGKCQQCGGTGLGPDIRVCLNDTLGIAMHYANILVKHGITELIPVDGWEKRTSCVPFYFKGDGFDGLVMSRANSDEDKDTVSLPPSQES